MSGTSSTSPGRTRQAPQAGDRLARAYARGRGRCDLDAAVAHHLPLARALARRYARAGSPADDLEQVACVGLVKALHRFDPDRGCSFRSFAVPTIVGELKRYCRDTAWSAHVPRPVQELMFRVRRAAADFESRNGRRPTVADLAAVLGIGEEEVTEALLAEGAMSPVSLDGPVADEGGAAIARIERMGEEDAGYERVECLVAIEGGMVDLEPTALELLRLRYVEDLTHPQIAARLGVPLSQVARRLAGAVERVAVVACA